MTRTFRTSSLFFALAALLTGQSQEWQVTASGVGREFDIALKVTPEKGSFVVRVATFTPGRPWPSAAVQSISDVQATNAEGATLLVEAQRDGTYRVLRAGASAVTIRWKVKAETTPSAYGYKIDGGLLLDPASTLLFVPELQGMPCKVSFAMPAPWNVATALPVVERTVVAESFAALTSSPIFVGKLTEWPFEVSGRKFRFVLDAVDTGSSAGAVLSSVNELIEAMPISRDRERPYLILCLQQVGDFRGFPDMGIFGLKANVLEPLSASKGFANAFAAQFTSGAKGPASFHVPDFSKEVTSDALWFRDGVREWTAWRALCRAKRVPATDVLLEIRRRILEYRNHPLAEKISPTAASKSVWERRGDDARGISHQLLGFLSAVQLDILLRCAGKEVSLDHLLAAASKAFPSGYETKELSKLATELGGEPLAVWFDDHVDHAKPVDFDGILERVGLMMKWTPWQIADPGVTILRHEGRLHVADVARGRIMAGSGLLPADVIEKVSQRDVQTEEDFDEEVSRLAPGDKLRLDVLRNGRPRSFKATCLPGVALTVPAKENEAGDVELTGLPKGVLADAGLRQGDVLYRMDKRRVNSLKDLPDAIARLRPGPCEIVVEREGKRQTFRVIAERQVIVKGRLLQNPKATVEEGQRLKRLLLLN